MTTTTAPALEATAAAARTHCESCGQEDPMFDDGYTTCCNELPCYGDGSYLFGTMTDNVTSCCWAKASKLFDAAGRPLPDGAHRMFID